MAFILTVKFLIHFCVLEEKLQEIENNLKLIFFLFLCQAKESLAYN